MREPDEERRHDSIRLAVVDAVAESTDTAPTELPPLADAIDPDAMEMLFESAAEPATDGELTFRYAGCEVVVRSGGFVSVTPTAEESTDWHSVLVEG